MSFILLLMFAGEPTCKNYNHFIQIYVRKENYAAMLNDAQGIIVINGTYKGMAAYDLIVDPAL